MKDRYFKKNIVSAFIASTLLTSNAIACMSKHENGPNSPGQYQCTDYSRLRDPESDRPHGYGGALGANARDTVTCDNEPLGPWHPKRVCVPKNWIRSGNPVGAGLE